MEASKKKSVEDLEQELQEARQFIEAIRSGEVDTILSTHPDEGALRLENVQLADERDRLMRELEQSNAFLQNILESISHPFYVVNVSDYSVILSNSAARKGRPPSHLPCYTLIHDRTTPCTEEDHICPLDEIVKTRRPVIMERLSMDDGEEKTLEVHGYPVFHPETKEIRCAIEYILDVTERKQAERELHEARKKAEEATKLKDKFVSLVSHDLRNPISSMLGFIRLACETMGDLASDGNDQPREMLKRALDTGNRMLSLVEELLNISRLKAGEIRPNLAFLDAQIAALQTVVAFSPKAEEKGIRLVNKIPAKSRIFADEALLMEVLYNMVDNAIKFSRRGGAVTLFLPEGKPSCLAVSDTGVGIDPQRLDILFKYEEKKSTKGTEGETGTGLGLPLCREIMEAHGGSLTVESTPGQGSVFHADFPTVRPEIYIVDDDIVSRKIIRHMLEGEDVEIFLMEDGLMALEATKSKRPHLVLLDLIMPNMDGFEFLERLKNTPEWESIPVIVLTSEGGMENRDRAFRLGANDLVTKPTSPEELLPRVRKFIG